MTESPTDRFVEAMRRLIRLNDRDDYRDLGIIQQAVEAVADLVVDAGCQKIVDEHLRKECRATLMKRVMGPTAR